MKSPAHLAQTFLKHAPWAARVMVTRGRPRHLVHFYGDTPGDDLMCTVVLAEMRKRGRDGIWMMSRFPELFANNTDADRVVPFDFRYQRYANWVGGEVLYAHYGGHDHVNDRSPVPERHIIALMCEACGLSGSVALRPRIFLTPDERAFGSFAKRQIVVHSSGQSAASAMLNKEWTPGRLQEVINALQGEYTFVQLGASTDPLLHGCTDLRGMTSIRGSAAIVANSTLLLGQVGFLMHMARAVDTPAVIIYGGREKPWQSGYPCNINLTTALPCSPCWRWNACDNPITRACMLDISVADVIAAVQTLAERPPAPLAVETVDLVPSHLAHNAPLQVAS